jgi:hypothetical protein
MLKKIALVGLVAFAASFCAAGRVAAKSSEATSVKPQVTLPAPQGLCPQKC